jgi:putative toxin-antitoxin system antitoxin component (TIGR02293 family)
MTHRPQEWGPPLWQDRYFVLPECAKCGKIAAREEEFSMSKESVKRRIPEGTSFEVVRTAYDSLVLSLFLNRALQRAVQDQTKTNLATLWSEIGRKLLNRNVHDPRSVLEPLEIHLKIVEGLPGEALFVSSAMAFDSMSEALQFFDVSAKTAKQRIGERLSSSESEVALRIGRVLTMAHKEFGSVDAAREYLRTPNFALGGAVPRDLLKTSEGEQLVLAELHSQAEGGPV